MIPDHRLYFVVQFNEAGTAGLWASCGCGDFRAWLEGVSAETELALLNLHAVHVEMPA